MKLTFHHSNGPTKFTVELGEELTCRLSQYLAYLQEVDPNLRRLNLTEDQVIAKIVQHFLDDDDEFRAYLRNGKVPGKRGRKKAPRSDDEPKNPNIDESPSNRARIEAI